MRPPCFGLPSLTYLACYACRRDSRQIPAFLMQVNRDALLNLLHVAGLLLASYFQLAPRPT